MRTGEGVLAVALTAVALIVMIGSPIWFSVKARRLGPLPYRWGTFVGSMSLLFSFGLLVTTLTNRKDSELPILAFIPVLGVAGAIGVLRRKRWGVVLFLLSQAALLLLGVVLQDSSESVMPAQQAVARVAGIGINLWYFGRRWRLLSRSNSEEYADSFAADQVGESEAEPQPPEAV